MAGATRTGERGGVMSSADVAGGGTRPSPLLQMTQTTPTCLWNDSASPELTYAIEHGAVGATCNPVIVLSMRSRREAHLWNDRIRASGGRVPDGNRRRDRVEAGRGDIRQAI